MNTVIAIPSAGPEGLDASIDAHFGHCAMYTLVEVKDGKVEKVDSVPSCPHEQGGCLAPVNYLAEKNVTKLISGGMGFRPLMGFNQAGIEVYHGSGAPTVRQAVDALLKDSLPVFTPDQTCGGGQH
ncbi:Dinitrogenase iron-molybdenum cofactor biosynthesis protein [Pseudodesulfovibrio profundus]|uniref:Dinitrogenase iron-molybdenum cofactor biosynthesis protein n=1 Tax=Pseudodesulfovibrio profundus TaxID=57320 RepID=A0A2C8F844_9BACT|nr:NifB/NifX family molybdenum-iron cluster-binding protein [Pseudodesulfovibrio profundus]MBC17464.1 dinitrogenase iron-molybdenum cofactor biosynthesis protein [Desulfovibrio sp.]MBC18248.1 dinitrogenase iron-molybdenum cofactor biosynthesis protein [Desulfovibrio sp.]SOB58808.1 Dinitrogenase iron-molybdenum cofactor biosynthesis protein [Pseudodesulfovibrio profundus]|tara:strand:+ start:11166 stop:11543 length:378 start_codon:yes stop_codon:yes gene_type:complete